MKKFLLTLALLLSALPTFAQTAVNPKPDCVYPFTFTAAGNGPDFDNRAGYKSTGFQNGCTTWTLVYYSTGFSVVSIEFQGAPDASGAAGTYGTWTVLPAGTTLPLTSITNSQATGYRYQPWVRVKVNTATGTGTISGVLMGWRPLSGQDSNSAVGAMSVNVAQFNGSTAVDAVHGINSVGAGIPTAAMVGEFDDASTSACTENQFCVARLDQNRRAIGAVTYGVSVLGDGLTNNIVVPYCAGSGGCQAAGTNNGIGFVVGLLTFNGSTWDKYRSVVNGQNTTGTGISAVGPLCQLDDTSTGAVTENQWAPCRSDSVRSIRVDTEGQKITYSATALNFAPVATPTDVCVLPGSASKTIRVTRIMVQGFATTKGSMPLQIIKRAAADTAGTSAGLTAIPYDSADAAASAAPLKYTANPTVNSTVGTYDTKSLNFAVAGDESVPYIFDTGYRGGAKALTLRGVAEQIAVNLNGAAVPTGGTIGCSFEWTEE